MRTLFAISEDLRALENLIESVDGDISDPQVEAAISGWLAELEKDQAVKTDAYVNLIRKWDNELAAAKAEAEQYRKIAETRANRVAKLKARLKEHMEATHQQRIETATGRTVAIQKNGGKAPLQIDMTTDPRQLEPRFQKTTVAIDTDAVRVALEAGESLDFASLLPVGSHLRIK
jgi:hypothetical protein